jgi:signal transduction histidine kinase
MNAIIGIAQIELQKEDLQSEYAASLEKSYSSGYSLLGIINDILDMSKIETGKMELVCTEYDVPSLISDTTNTNMVHIGSKLINFILELDENLPSRLIGDELRIRQVLNNLLSNAIKYTDEGMVKMSVNFSDDFLHFIVTDTGQGMKPEDLQKLFSDYSRFNMEANRTTEGTGLGLNIAKSFVEMMDGEISVESEFGKGSTFSVKIRQESVDAPPIGAALAKQLCSL